MTWKLPGLRPGHPAAADLVERREFAGSVRGSADPAVTTSETRIEGVRCLTVTPHSWERELIYMHGGGYRMGSPEGWVGLASSLALRLGCRVTVPDYRLAPEDPFPAALHDATAAYGRLRSSEGRPVIAAGDSAGGGLAAALTVACAMSGEPPPEALILLSPWLDLTISGETFVSRADHDRFFPASAATEAAEAYLQGHDATDPLASPLYADVSEFPPTLILAGTEETLLDDAVRFASHLADARRGVALHVVAGMQHAWPVISPELPESAEALETVGHFTRLSAGAAADSP